MITLLRTNSDNPHFLLLVKDLDHLLQQLDGEEHAFYATLNKTNTIKHTIVALENDEPVGCGAIREFDADSMEVKRMYVPPEKRRQGIAALILSELEKWSAELSYSKCVLETGNRQPEAIALYLREGYKIIPNYGKYKDVSNSVCFEKVL